MPLEPIEPLPTEGFAGKSLAEAQHSQLHSEEREAINALISRVQLLEEAKVSGEGISHILKLTQAEYDAIEVKDPETFYVVVG